MYVTTPSHTGTYHFIQSLAIVAMHVIYSDSISAGSTLMYVGGGMVCQVGGGGGGAKGHSLYNL